MNNKTSFRSKRISVFLCILALLVCVGCGGRPRNVLSEKKMVDLMVDMELAEAYASTMASGNRNNERIVIGKRVLASHGVSEETLDTTLAWYGKNLDEYSALFEKVDQEINRRKQLYMRESGLIAATAENLWPFGPHQVISERSGYEGLIISLQEPPVNNGGRIQLSFYLPKITNLKGTLGVEYQDGSGEATTTVFNNKSKVEMELQTDTAKNVARIYGTFNIKDRTELPVYIDSLKIITLDYDSVEYRQKRLNQKKFGIPVFMGNKNKPYSLVKDTTRSESGSPLEQNNSVAESETGKKEPETNSVFTQSSTDNKTIQTKSKIVGRRSRIQK